MSIWPAQLGHNDAKPTANQGGTLVLDLPHRPSQNGAATPRLTVYGPDGTAYVANTAATISGPSTLPTLSQGVTRSRGSTVDSQWAVSSTSGLEARMRLLIGSGAANQPAEVIRVRSVLDANHFISFGPALLDHPAGVSLGGVRLTATIAAGLLPDRFRRGQVVWEWGSEGSATRDEGTTTAADVVRYPLKRLATVDGLRSKVDAAFYAKIPQQRDPEEILERGWEEVGSRLYQRAAFGFVTSDSLELPTLYYGAAFEVLGWGPQWKEASDNWMDVGNLMLERAIQINPIDPNEDAVLDSRETKTGHEIRITRGN